LGFIFERDHNAQVHTPTSRFSQIAFKRALKLITPRRPGLNLQPEQVLLSALDRLM
jgi:hypothetical protein